MSLYFKAVLIIFGLAYLISPVDILPDILLPYIGWIDDGIVIGTVFYLIKYGRLPNFFFKKQQSANRPLFNREPAGDTSKNQRMETPDQKKQSSQTVPRTPYDILGILPNASKNEIQAAYKEAVKKYHPDKLSHLGEEFSNLANKKFLEIQKAYDTLMKKY